MLFSAEFHFSSVGDDGWFAVKGCYLHAADVVLFHERRQEKEKQKIETSAEIETPKKNRRTA